MADETGGGLKLTGAQANCLAALRNAGSSKRLERRFRSNLREIELRSIGVLLPATAATPFARARHARPMFA
jgi:hypothetical protein